MHNLLSKQPFIHLDKKKLFFWFFNNKCHFVQARITGSAIVAINYGLIDPWSRRFKRRCKLAFFSRVFQWEFLDFLSALCDNCSNFQRIGIPHTTWCDWAASHHGQVGRYQDLFGTFIFNMGWRRQDIDNQPGHFHHPGITPCNVLSGNNPLRCRDRVGSLTLA